MDLRNKFRKNQTEGKWLKKISHFILAKSNRIVVLQEQHSPSLSATVRVLGTRTESSHKNPSFAADGLEEILFAKRK